MPLLLRNLSFQSDLLRNGSLAKQASDIHVEIGHCWEGGRGRIEAYGHITGLNTATIIL